jgi:hypothetical protein
MAAEVRRRLAAIGCGDRAGEAGRPTSVIRVGDAEIFRVYLTFIDKRRSSKLLR